MKKEKGFTLVELLATIVILGIILSIVGYVVFDSMKKAKEKTYQVTINEIENNANNYMVENSDKIFFVTDNETGNEYQCLTVNDLIDAGYLKTTITESEVAKDTFVTLEDYIYIVRNGTTKSIDKSVYIKKDNYTGSKDCDIAVNARGNIIISVSPGVNTWSKTKDVTISYTLRNLGGEYDLANYDYTYSFDGVGTLTKDEGALKKLNVTKEGNLIADIIYKPDGSQVYGTTMFIGRIDNIQPVVGLGKYTGSKTVSGSVKIPLVVTDKESGVDYGTFTKDDIEVTVGGKVPTSYSLTHGSGDNYTLTITDNNLDGVIKIMVGANKFTDKAGNGNKAATIDNLDINFKNTYILSYSPGSCKDVSGAMTAQTVKYNANFTPKNNEYVCKGYTFNGWKDKAGTAFPIKSQKWTYTENKELIAQWKAKTVKVTYYRNQTTSDATTQSQTFTYGVSGNRFGFKTDGTPQWTLSGQFGTWNYTGRTLLGWSANRSATAKTWNTYSNVSDDWINNNSPAINIYAVWILNTYTVTFNGNGGSVSSGSKTVTYSGTYGTLPTATRTNYTFDGWYTAASGGTKITATSTVSITKNQTLYAHWKLNTYTITLDRQSGTGGTGSVSTQYNQYPPSVTIPSRSGYKFMGYYENTGGAGKQYYNSSGGALKKWDKQSNGTLYAYWVIDNLMSTWWDEANFLSTTIKKTDITKVIFTDSIGNRKPNNVDIWDVGEYKSESVLAWVSNKSGGKYEITIGQNGGVKANSQSSYLFYGMTSLTSIAFNNKFITKDVINMNGMFEECPSLTSLDLSSFNTSNVTSMANMFAEDINLSSLNISSFNTAKVTKMSRMFFNCSSLTSLNLSNFNTANVTEMAYMFYNCSKVTSINVTSFNTSKVTSFKGMFYGCNELVTLDVSKFNTSSATNMRLMFTDCYKLKNINVSNFDTSNVTDMGFMFDNCSSLQALDVSKFNTSKVTDMTHMFFNCGNVPTLNVANFDTSNCTSFSNMFAFCFRLSSLDLSKWKTSKVTNMSYMFKWCIGLTSIKGIENFNTSNVTTMSHTFQYCEKLTSLNLTKWDTAKVTDMSGMLSNLKLTTIDIRNFKTTSLQKNASMFHDDSNLVTLYLPNDNFTKGVAPHYVEYEISYVSNYQLVRTDKYEISYMFDNCRSLRTIYVKDNANKNYINERLGESPGHSSFVTISTY